MKEIAAPILFFIAMIAFALSLAYRPKFPATKSDAPGNNKLFWTRCILGGIATILIVVTPDAPPVLKIIALLIILVCILLAAFVLFAWLFSGRETSETMEGKQRLYDRDGNIIGYMDKDDD